MSDQANEQDTEGQKFNPAGATGPDKGDDTEGQKFNPAGLMPQRETEPDGFASHRAVEDEDTEGQKFNPAGYHTQRATEDDDTEGHKFNPAGFASKDGFFNRTGAVPSDDEDTEGHKMTRT